MKNFNVPADFKKSTIKKYKELSDSEKGVSISETYGQLTDGFFVKSGRAKKHLPQVDMKCLETYVDYSLVHGIKFNYTINPACLGNYEFTKQGIKAIKRFLEDLYNIGIRDLTVTSPAIVELIKDTGLDFDIKISAINHVDSIFKLELYKKMGVKRIVIEPDLNRDFGLINKMAKFWGSGLEVIVNDVCYRNCPYKIFHYNYEAHGNDHINQVNNYYFMRCGIQKSQNIRNYLKLNWIRPEDINLYIESGIENFKLQGRPYVNNGDVVKATMCYAQERFEGNLLDLLHLFAPYDSAHQPYINNQLLDGFISGFYSRKIECSELCDQCRYCDSYADKAIECMDELLSDAIEFYSGNDQFQKMINRIDI